MTGNLRDLPLQVSVLSQIIKVLNNLNFVTVLHKINILTCQHQMEFIQLFLVNFDNFFKMAPSSLRKGRTRERLLIGRDGN